VSASRASIPLSVKLMLTTSIVVAAAVAISAWFGQRTIAELARDDVAARRTTGEAAIVREAELLTKNVATATAIPMAQQAFGEVGPLIAATLRDYPRIQWIAVASDGKLVAATPGAPTVVFDDLTDARGAIGHRRVAPDKPDWIYGSDIRLGEQVLGQLRLGVSTAELDAELAAAWWRPPTRGPSASMQHRAGWSRWRCSALGVACSRRWQGIRSRPAAAGPGDLGRADRRRRSPPARRRQPRR
jgi:hypothetical protein